MTVAAVSSIRSDLDAIVSIMKGDRRAPVRASQPGSGGDATAMFIPIAKASEDVHTITGVVLQPEVVDGHGDIMSADVIREAAHSFLENYNKSTRLKNQHKEANKGRLQLVESWIAPMDMAIGSKMVKKGSWIMTMKVLDSEMWKKIKDGLITGFSIGGRARVQSLQKA